MKSRLRDYPTLVPSGYMDMSGLVIATKRSQIDDVSRMTGSLNNLKDLQHAD
jgi:hypothetical protein